MWLWLQGVYALAAWAYSVRVVARVASLAGAIDGGVIEAVRALRRQGEGLDALIASDELHPDVQWVLCAAREGELATDRMEWVLARTAPPSLALRGLATIGTSLGLLGAIVTLRGVIGGGGGAARAFESALLGFVTAIPVWSALALAAQRSRRTARQCERLAELLDLDPSADASVGSEPESSDGDDR